MKKMSRLMAAFAAAVLVASPALAGRLPESAQKATPSQVNALYSGHSAHLPGNTFYFDPSGHLIYANDKAFGEGTWSVSGNTICAKSRWRSAGGRTSGSSRDCWTWYKDGATWYTQYKDTNGRLSPWFTVAVQRLRPGDDVSTKYEELRRKFEKQEPN